ncbi:MAG: signal peptidase I [Candidatus Kapabacteria bacterium]|nr:signal peptidase I [Candidatus Kapabacteria bacterium]
MSDKGLADLSWRDLITTALFAVVVALALRLFVLGVYTIPSHSMEDTILEGDYILVSKLAFRLRDVHRGDIIIFSLPDTLRGEERDDLYIKRLIGLPGDTVRLTSVFIEVNGEPIPEPPEAKPPFSPLLGIGAEDVVIVVPEKAYFVLGDNRSNSYDSRYWGCLPSDRVEGAPLFVYWSFGSTNENIVRHIRWDRLFTRIL